MRRLDYLRDEMIGRNHRGRDGRNPYGSRGGYVSSSRGRDSSSRGMMGTGRMSSSRNMGRDYGMYDYNDYNNDYTDYDYNDYGYRDMAEMDEDWHTDLKEWCKKLKREDRFNIPKEDVLKRAKQMGVSFDDYDEEEFITTYYMMMSDHPKAAAEPNAYINMAKEFLEDKDAERKGSDKLCAYYYNIVKAD